jgi:hypothetical protein
MKRNNLYHNGFGAGTGSSSSSWKWNHGAVAAGP